MGTPSLSSWQVTLPFEGQGEDKKKKISVSQKPKPLRQLPATGALQHIGSFTMHGFIWYFFIYGGKKKNDVSGYVIFNATLLDFTVK